MTTNEFHEKLMVTVAPALCFFCARQHMLYAIARLSVRCHTGGSVKNGWS